MHDDDDMVTVHMTQSDLIGMRAAKVFVSDLESFIRTTPTISGFHSLFEEWWRYQMRLSRKELEWALSISGTKLSICTASREATERWRKSHPEVYK